LFNPYIVRANRGTSDHRPGSTVGKDPPLPCLHFVHHVLVLSRSSKLDGSCYLTFLFLLSGLLWTRHSLQWEPLCNLPHCMQSNLEKAILHERMRWFLGMD
jgi:hypothetical protein